MSYTRSTGSNSLAEVLNKPSFRQSLMNGNTQTSTHMAKLMPNKSFQPPKVNTSALKRDVNQKITDAPQVKATAANSLKQTEATKADFQQTFDKAQGVAMDHMKGSAVDMNMDPRNAAASVGPGQTTTHAVAAAAIVLDVVAAGGAGSMAMVAQGGSAARDIKQEAKGLKPDEVKALMDETLTSLQSGPQDTRAQNIMGDAPQGESPQSEFQWENMTPEDLEDFLGSTADQQPEMVALNETINELKDEVLTNHAHMDDNYEKTATAGKIEAASENGDLGLAERMMLASESFDGFGGNPKGTDNANLGQDAKTAIASLHNEPAPQPEFNNELSMTAPA